MSMRWVAWVFLSHLRFFAFAADVFRIRLASGA